MWLEACHLCVDADACAHSSACQDVVGASDAAFVALQNLNPWTKYLVQQRWLVVNHNNQLSLLLCVLHSFMVDDHAEKPIHAATARVRLSRFHRLCKLHGVETCQGVIASDIICPEQITSITIERAVWCWIWHESNDSLAYRLECPCWAPSCFQDVQTDFTSLQM